MKKKTWNMLSSFAMAVAGAVLIFAGFLKIHQLLTERVQYQTIFDNWEFYVLEVPIEIGLGIWLLCGLFRKAGWLLGVLCFGVFTCVTAYKMIYGFESCGCFGVIHVDPMITLFAVDVPIFLSLLIFRRRKENLFPPPWPRAEHFWGVALPTFVLLISIMVVIVTNKVEIDLAGNNGTRPIIKNPNGGVVEPNLPDVNNVDPNTATNGDGEVFVQGGWSMLDYIDVADELTEGIVVVLFYHNSCPDCKRYIPIYEQYARDNVANGIRFAFIEAPEYEDDVPSPVPADTICVVGRLSENPAGKWMINTPLVVLVIDGVAIKKWDEGTAPEFGEIIQAIGE